MQQKSLSKWLKFIIVGIGLCGLVGYAFVIPVFGNDILNQYPEYSYCYYPWIAFLWLTAVPCYIVLYFGWKISENIGNDNSFCKENAVMMKKISVLAAGDSIFFFVGNIIYWIIGLNHPSIVLGAFVIVFIGISITIAAAVLSHLVIKAAKLKEENDLTI